MSDRDSALHSNKSRCSAPELNGSRPVPLTKEQAVTSKSTLLSSALSPGRGARQAECLPALSGSTCPAHLGTDRTNTVWPLQPGGTVSLGVRASQDPPLSFKGTKASAPVGSTQHFKPLTYLMVITPFSPFAPHVLSTYSPLTCLDVPFSPSCSPPGPAHTTPHLKFPL